MTADLGILLVVVIVGFGGLYWLVNKRLSSTSANAMDSNELVQTVIAVAKEKLEGDKQQISADVTAKKEAIELLVNDLRKDINERQKEIRQLEQDRNLKFGEISKSIEEHKVLTSDLQGSTDDLRRVLSSSQLRGSWGERQVEQIFTTVGLLKQQHYLVQQVMGNSSVRPDFTILLPGGKKLCVDAKFPFSNLQLMAQTDDKVEKARLDKLFASDVKARINEIATKGYISEEDGTCDYAVMFVPSEAVFEHINRAHPQLVDEALGKKVLMASPYSLVAIIRTISESYKNFYYESSMREIVKKVDVFLNDWRLFEDEFGKFGKNLNAAVADYEKITSTRYRLMGSHIKQIQDARSGTKQLDEVNGPVVVLDEIIEE